MKNQITAAFRPQTLPWKENVYVSQARGKRRSPKKEPTHINVSVGEIHEFSQQILGKLLCARHYPKCCPSFHEAYIPME